MPAGRSPIRPPRSSAMSVDAIEAPAAVEAQSAAPAPKAGPRRTKPKAAKKPVKKPAVRPVKAKPSANGKVQHGELLGLAASHPKWAGKTCNFRRDGALTARQVAVLNVLSKRSRPASASDVADVLKVPEASRKTVNWAVGAVRSETVDPFSLLGRKLVKHVPVDSDGRTEHLFEITAPGRKALAAAKK